MPWFVIPNISGILLFLYLYIVTTRNDDLERIDSISVPLKAGFIVYNVILILLMFITRCLSPYVVSNKQTDPDFQVSTSILICIGNH